MVDRVLCLDPQEGAGADMKRQRLVRDTSPSQRLHITVGTTSLRLLERAADDQRRIQAFEGGTDVFITPGDRFRGIDRLMRTFTRPSRRCSCWFWRA